MKALLLLLVTASCTCTSIADSLDVRGISITGLRRTKPWVVEREFQWLRGSVIATSDLEKVRGRLSNLNFFNEVRVSVDSTDTVKVQVTEAWPLLPIASVSFTEGQLGDVHSTSDFLDIATIYVGATHLNFRGSGAKLEAFAQFGAAEGFSVEYTSRWLSPKLPLACFAALVDLRISDRHAAVFDSTRRLRSRRASLEIGTRRGVPSQIGADFRYQQVKQEDSWPAEGRSFNIFWWSPYLLLDHRDVEWYPTRGALAAVRTNLGLGTETFTRSYYDLRGYWGLPQFSLLGPHHRPPVVALRIYAATSSHQTPSWAHNFSGFNQGYRGYRTIKRESAEELSGQFELRIPVIRESHYNVRSLGSLGKRIPWGVTVVGGIERFRQQLDGMHWEGLGYGAGLLFRMPYVHLLECSVEWNREGEMESSISTGIRF